MALQATLQHEHVCVTAHHPPVLSTVLSNAGGMVPLIRGRRQHSSKRLRTGMMLPLQKRGTFSKEAWMSVMTPAASEKGEG